MPIWKIQAIKGRRCCLTFRGKLSKEESSSFKKTRGSYEYEGVPSFQGSDFAISLNN